MSDNCEVVDSVSEVEDHHRPISVSDISLDNISLHSISSQPITGKVVIRLSLFRNNCFTGFINYQLLMIPAVFLGIIISIIFF